VSSGADGVYDCCLVMLLAQLTVMLIIPIALSASRDSRACLG
jgi:hypothetical protein